MSTSNPPDEDSFLGNVFLPLSGDSSLRDQSSRIRALEESQVSDFASEMTSSHKKLDLLVSLMAEKSSDKPSSPSIPTPASPPPATRQSMGGLVLTPGIGTNSVQLPSSVGTVTVLSTQLANLRPKTPRPHFVSLHLFRPSVHGLEEYEFHHRLILGSVHWAEHGGDNSTGARNY